MCALPIYFSLLIALVVGAAQARALAGAAAITTAQLVYGSGRGMGDLLAAVHPFGPCGLRLLLRVGGAVCGFACAHLAGASRPGRSTAAGLCAVPSSTETDGARQRLV